jgi:hypothetical protein
MERKKFTADDLKRWLDEFPKQSDNMGIRALWFLSPRGRALSRIAENVYSFSLQKGEVYTETKDRLEDARSLFLNLMSTLTGSWSTIEKLWEQVFKVEIWDHREVLLDEFYQKGYGNADEYYFFMRGRMIASFAADLLKRPWLKSHYMEWVIVDSLICNKIRQYGQSILGNPPLFPLLLARGFSKKGVEGLCSA